MTPAAVSDKTSQQRIGQIEELVNKFETSADPATRADVRKLVQAILEFHGAAVDRMMEIMVEAEPEPIAFEGFARDELVSGMLLLHGLHPLDFETRVAQALDKARPILLAQAADVQLVRIDGNDVVLRFQGKASAHLKTAIEDEIYKYAADVTALQIDGMESLTSKAGELVKLTR